MCCAASQLLFRPASSLQDVKAGASGEETLRALVEGSSVPVQYIRLTTMPRRNNAPLAIALPTASSVCASALANPRDIDNLVLTHLQEVSSNQNQRPLSLAKHLSGLLGPEVTRCVTPPLLWGGDPSWSKAQYRACLVHATVLGQAFSLSHLPSPNDPTLYLGYEIEELWAIMQDIFVKGLFTSDPEVGAWFAAGILILTCSDTLKTSGVIDGKGKDWVWYSGKLGEPDVKWGWEDLKKAVMETESLPRDRTRWDYTKAQRQSIKPEIYVPEEVLYVFDKAREHLSNDNLHR